MAGGEIAIADLALSKTRAPFVVIPFMAATFAIRYRERVFPRGNRVFDTTLTDIEFKDSFVNKDADWLQSARRPEPDLAIDGLGHSLLSRLLELVGIN